MPSIDKEAMPVKEILRVKWNLLDKEAHTL
jgi:hypothetical protein